MNILFEEYRARREEINHTLSAAYSTSNITLIGIGAMLTISPTIYKENITGIFALFAILFFAINWTQLRFMIQVFNLSNYIIYTIAPRVRVLLQRSDEIAADFASILSWEGGGRKQSHSSTLWAIPLEASRFGIPLFAAVISSLIFILTLPKSGFLFWVNIVLLFTIAFSLIYSIYALFNTRKLLKSTDAEKLG